MNGVGRACIAAALALTGGIAKADEPRGCDQFKRPIAQEQVALDGSQKPEIEVGGAIKLDQAASMLLVPRAQARLQKPPERTPTETASYAGMVSLEPSAAGAYKVSLSGDGWIDVIQGDEFLKPTAVTGALDCPGVRKSVKFQTIISRAQGWQIAVFDPLGSAAARASHIGRNEVNYLLFQ
jgi:hypothetical protein